MKYKNLFLALFKGLLLIGVITWILLEIKQHSNISENLFIILAGGAIGGSFAYAANIYSREVKKLNG